jgi:cytochrome P450
MEAGSDTTASTLLSFLLAMIKYPTEFKKAQEEVDEVCGSSRSPTAEDIDRLPFIKACMHEVREVNPIPFILWLLIIFSRPLDGAQSHRVVYRML